MQVEVKLLRIGQRDIINIVGFRAHLTLQEYMSAVYLEMVKQSVTTRNLVSSEEVLPCTS